MDDYQRAEAATARQAEILAAGEKVAEKMALRMKAAYEKGVAECWQSYAGDNNLPDEEDFFAWVEGYRWEE